MVDGYRATELRKKNVSVITGRPPSVRSCLVAVLRLLNSGIEPRRVVPTHADGNDKDRPFDGNVRNLYCS